MKKDSIKNHLKDYSIYHQRRTTINHAFASALSIPDDYSEERLNKALMVIGQNPDDDLFCVYCGRPAQTWDHIYGLVKNGEFSGYGHQLGNLLPCCKQCNSAKGNKDWGVFLESIIEDETELLDRKERISRYIRENSVQITSLLNELTEELKEYNSIKNRIFKLMIEGDRVAGDIRSKAKKKF